MVEISGIEKEYKIDEKHSLVGKRFTVLLDTLVNEIGDVKMYARKGERGNVVRIHTRFDVIINVQVKFDQNKSSEYEYYWIPMNRIEIW